MSAVGAVGAVSAEAASSPNITRAASSPNITRAECTAVGGQITSSPYAGYGCTLSDGTTEPIT
ncbi:hypothetical protein ACFRAO_36370 [Streptomyces sp. NPDC056656]|uniref:hypothetical protein n=1 Tax=Streptomyces sp. NPDC056656 TaxID=3345895 RepID=UPI0036B10127